jgi:hypothetical protein
MKTSELTGAALDWAVAKCEVVAVRWSAAHEQLLVDGYPYRVWQPHTNWLQGGPIIEREGIGLHFDDDDNDPWAARPYLGDTWNLMLGPTPLIAAMRCYVASKLGEEVEIPEELK